MRFKILFPAIVLITSLIFLSIGLNNVGEHWDEVTVASAGESYLGFIKNGDFSQNSWELNHEHPPVAKYIYGTARFLTKNVSFLQDKSGYFDRNKLVYYPVGRDFLFARFFSVVMSALTLAIVFLIAWELTKSRKIALLASAILFVNPVFQSYARIVSLEVPLLLFGSLFVWFSLKYANTKSLKNYIAVVVSFAMLIGTRYNGLLLLPFFYFVNLTNWSNLTNLVRRLANYRNLLMPVFSLMFLVCIWPYLWVNPIGHLLTSADRGLEVHTREYFLGQLGNTPWSYYFVYFGVRTPLILLAGFVAGALSPARLNAFHAFGGGRRVLLLVLFLLPFLASLLPLKQDGLRYVNLYLIGFSIICAVGMSWVIGEIRVIGIKFLILITTATLLIINLFNYFPNYLDYYNGLVPSNRIYFQRLFEIGGWGEGVLEAVKNLPKPKNGEISKVYLAISPVHIIPDLPEGYKATADFSQADFVIINTNYRWYDNMVQDKDLENFKLINTISAGEKFPLVSTYRRN